jgi:hypothetical protein
MTREERLKVLATKPYAGDVKHHRQVHVIIYFGAENWIAETMIPDIATQAPSIEDAKRAFEELFMANVAIARDKPEAKTALDYGAPEDDHPSAWPLDKSAYQFFYAIAHWEPDTCWPGSDSDSA